MYLSSNLILGLNITSLFVTIDGKIRFQKSNEAKLLIFKYVFTFKIDSWTAGQKEKNLKNCNSYSGNMKAKVGLEPSNFSMCLTLQCYSPVTPFYPLSHY